MRMVEQRIAGARAALRRLVSRAAPVDRLRPARLVLRLDEVDLPGSLGDGPQMSLAAWRKALVGAVDWLGPLPVTVLATHSAQHKLLPELVRFAHRLECPTLLVTDGVGIDLDRAEELIDRGLAKVRVLVASLDEEVQRDVVGGGAAEAQAAVQALLSARRERRSSLDVEIGQPWSGQAATSARAVLGWARQIGADGLRVLPPWQAARVADPALLDELVREGGSFLRSEAQVYRDIAAMHAAADGQPGLPRSEAELRLRGRRCPVGGQRLELSARSRVSACPFHAPIGEFSEDIRGLWTSGGAHQQAIAACGRACAHPELAPDPLFAATR